MGPGGMAGPGPGLPLRGLALGFCLRPPRPRLFSLRIANSFTPSPSRAELALVPGQGKYPRSCPGKCWGNVLSLARIRRRPLPSSRRLRARGRMSLQDHTVHLCGRRGRGWEGGRTEGLQASFRSAGRCQLPPMEQSLQAWERALPAPGTPRSQPALRGAAQGGDAGVRGTWLPSCL